MCTCVFLINLYLLFSEAHIIFGNGIKHKKKHEKCLFSLSARSFIHFPASRGAFFLLLSGRHRRSGCLTGPRERLGVEGGTNGLL